MKRGSKILLSIILCLVVTLNVFADEKRPTVALVLAGGGAKGYVHIATIELLEKYGIPVDYVVGTSMGALIGGLYSAGYSASDIVNAVRNADVVNSVFNVNLQDYALTTDTVFDNNNIGIGFDKNGITSRTGFVDDTLVINVINRLMRRVSNVDDFDKFYRAFRAVAVDFNTGEVVPLKRGHVVEAMRASMSIPVAFPVFKVGNRYLVDGGVKENVPIVTAINEFKPDIIIVSDCTAARYKNEQGVDIRSRLDKGTIGVFDVVNQAMALGNATSDEVKRKITSLSDLVIEYDTSKFGTASFSEFEDILAQAHENAKLKETGFKELAERLKGMGLSIDPTGRSYYQILDDPRISTLVVSGNERYRQGINDELYDIFSKYKGVTLDDKNTLELEKTIRDVQGFYGMSHLYYNINAITPEINQLEIKFDFPPQRQHNIYLDADLNLSLQMTRPQSGNSSGNKNVLDQFGFSFLPEVKLGYKYMISPETNMDSISTTFSTDAHLKNNCLSVFYTNVFKRDEKFVMFLSPKLTLYAGQSALNGLFNITNSFSMYDYGAALSGSYGYVNKFNSLIMSLGLDFRYFGTGHQFSDFFVADRIYTLRPFFEFTTVFGRKDYHVLDFNTGYRVELNADVGVDFGNDLLGANFTKNTVFPYSFQIRAEGTWRVHNYCTLGFNVEAASSRRALDLDTSYYTYGTVKGMPGFSLQDHALDYYLFSLNLMLPLSLNDAATPGFMIRLAIGSHDKIRADYDEYIIGLVNAGEDLIDQHPYSAYRGNFTPFMNMKSLNVGIGAYFTLHSFIGDLIVGAGYEFMEKKVSISLEIW